MIRQFPTIRRPKSDALLPAPNTCYIALAAMLASGLSLETATASTDKTLHSFVGGRTGSTPHADLVMDKAGNLYGTTQYGGDTVGCPGDVPGCGVVFKLAPPASGQARWTATVLHRFSAGASGSFPLAGLAIGPDGTLYGTTQQGGAGGKGTVFALTPPASGTAAWSYRVLHGFSGTDGDTPQARVTLYKGALYGTTTLGGTGTYGVVFALTPPAAGAKAWSETVLHDFDGQPDGEVPTGALAIDGAGAIYGTTNLGGADGPGTVYRLVPPAKGQKAWRETVLHSFTGGSDGGYPLYDGVVVDRNGAVYGATQSGGFRTLGAVYKLTPPAPGHAAWKETVLHSFGADNDGATPAGDLAIDGSGALYGTTELGGVSGYGSVFTLTPPAAPATAWHERVLHSFHYSPEGSEPMVGALTLDGAGRLYGATTEGGDVDACASSGCGTVFQITP